MPLRQQIDFIRKHNVQVYFTQAEADALINMLCGVVTSSVAEAGVLTKLGDAFKKGLKIAMKAIIPFLVLVPTASGMTLKDPVGYAKTVEKVAKSTALINLKIEAKEAKKGNLQVVVFKITDAAGSHSTIEFVGTESNALHNLELKSGGENAPNFDAFVQAWYDSLGKRIDTAGE
jgi:hypothetical protein